jgi:hypothetical protein
MGTIMSRVKLVGIAAAVTLIGLSSPGYALNFTFSFTNTLDGVYVPGTVTGEIFGLADNAISAATDVTITSYPANTSSAGFTFPTSPLDLFASPWTVNHNQFAVSGGEITAFEFVASGSTNTNTTYITPFFNSSDFIFQLCSVSCLPPAYVGYIGGVLAQYQTIDSDRLLEGQTFSPDVTINVQGDGTIEAATPLPAALPLLATGLGALGLLGWRRKRKNAAA